MFEEFRKFIARGNVIDLAVGVIIGASFGTVVQSMVKDILMPPIGLLLGGVDFSNLFINLSEGEFETLAAAQEAGAATINYGLFLNNIIYFLITAFAIFIVVREFNQLRERFEKKEEEAPADPTEKDCPYCMTKISINATRCPNCTSDLTGS